MFIDTHLSISEFPFCNFIILYFRLLDMATSVDLRV